MAFSGSQRTRHGLYGGARAPYSSFDGKTFTTTPPWDDDTTQGDGSSITVTATVDADAATIRAPRPVLLHAFDSARNADLVEPELLDMDRYSARSLRAGRARNEGMTVRVDAYTARAGNAMAGAVTVLDLVPRGTLPVAAPETTARAADDGSSIAVPTVKVYTGRGNRNGDLGLGGASRDRFATIHDVSRQGAVGTRLRIDFVGDGRAGNAMANRRLVLTLTAVGDKDTLARAT
jgi:hypothetical protein